MNKEEKRAKWMKQGPALIKNPMRVIYDKSKDAVEVTTAKIAAKAGNGKFVTQLARKLMQMG